MRSAIIAPSILAADLACLGEEVTEVLHVGADWIHFDVMDNHYVPNLTFGPVTLQALRAYGITCPIDVHLMTKPVDSLITAFAKAGANYISFHPDASDDVNKSISLIHEFGCKAGLAFNPEVPLQDLQQYIDKIDLVLLMAVNPGFGGQKFIPEVLNKIKTACSMIAGVDREILVSVDGGVNLHNVGEIAASGANVFVAGTAIFNTADYRQTIMEMRKKVEG